ncbi:type IV secretory system conjugative DNA transfer family protein [Brevibacterium aurantiacum]|uniref:Type IV secretory pathway, VirD4 component, TraG/TraD family ATPase n=1 Tax=Brevibacterium aurantiacum TaxID=273384 RepID=A0A2H1K2F9_BREAU|nr:TraM recognition domain-containing protein [Brevibacterium aurantiacum]AZT97642.1 type VI secretion protein [Brevibacterium aurantiacum]SMX93748.1 Type IV secretory pathway, VirD4 component, TraG/TraD family ATPase [Brevibacterium aurantiacum]
MQNRPPNDQLVSAALGAVAGFGALALLLRGIGSVAAFLTGLPAPTGGPASGLGVFAAPLDPGSAIGAPGLNAFLFWTLVLLTLTGLGVGAGFIWRSVRRTKDRQQFQNLAGTASADEVVRVASRKALIQKAQTLRPSLPAKPSPDPREVGYLLGTAKGGQVWATIEDSMLLLGPPRSGKGVHIIINSILDAAGPVITTSTRPDNLTVTMKARERIGPTALFDPQQLAPGLPSGMRWSPVRGCQDPLTAMIRAKGLATAANFGGVSDAGFWEGKTTAAIQAMLHAAALDGRGARTLYQWALNPTSAGDAVRILSTNSDAADGWSDSLDAMVQADPRTRDSIWQGVSLAFSALADPRVLDAVSPKPDEEFDPETFLLERGTLYLLATGSGSGAAAALVSAFVEDLVETGRKIAARSAGARLDPAMLLALDEIGNLAPIPALPTLMAEGGGTGITCLPVLQSLAQAREKWGDNNAGAIWDASIVKILLGGASNSRDLQDLSTLVGERDETTDSVTIDAYGSHSSQRSIRRVPILPPDVLRTMPFGTGVVMLRTARPIITKLRPWSTRPDAKQLRADRAEVEALLHQGVPSRTAPARDTDDGDEPKSD